MDKCKANFQQFRYKKYLYSVKYVFRYRQKSTLFRFFFISERLFSRNSASGY